MFRGKVTAVTDAGVYVLCADVASTPIGPCQAVVASYTVGGEVLVVNVGTDVQPDLVVVGKVSVSRNIGINGSAPDFGATSRTLQVNSGADGYAAVLAESEGRVVQVLVSDNNGVSAVGTRSNHPLTICTNDTARITIYDGGGQVVVNAGGPDAGVALNSVDGPRIMSGTGSPEGVVSAPVSSLWLRSDGGAGTSLYVKQSGTGNTGWAAK
jgi:hypothetical protein